MDRSDEQRVAARGDGHFAIGWARFQSTHKEDGRSHGQRIVIDCSID